MRIRPRAEDRSEAGGQTATVRTHRDFRTLLTRVEPGDLVVVDRRDLDAASAKQLADRRPLAVLNASEFVSGRFANLGPSVLLDAGVILLEGDTTEVRALKAGTAVRLDGDVLYAGDSTRVAVHRLTSEEVHERMDRARMGMASQLDTFAHTASEFLRREQGVLLNGTGLPELRTSLARRAVVVVGPHTSAAELRRLSSFVRQERPVLIGVDEGAELLSRKRRPDVVVLSRDAAPSERTIRRAREVVLHGAGDAVRRQVDKANLPTHQVATSVSSTDVALLIAHQAGARLIVPVGDPATLEELIDRERSDQASTVLTRMRLGTSVVEADAVPLLHTGRVRAWHLIALLLVAIAVLSFTIAATPIGNDWWHQLVDHLPGHDGGAA